MGDHSPRLEAEGRSALGRVESGQPAAGASSEVVQAAAGAQSLDDALDRARDLVEADLDRLDGAAVLGLHDGQQLPGREPVKLVGARMGTLAHASSRSRAASPLTRPAPCVAM